MARSYNFKKDAASDDGREIDAYLSDAPNVQTLQTIPKGTFAIKSGTRVGPGTLGPLPTGTTFRRDGNGGTVLIVT